MSTKHIALAAAGVVAITFGSVGPASAAGLSTPAVVLAGEVDQELAENLQFMREEERLAHELYTLLAEQYPEAGVFANIARSEARHMAAVGRQLDRYDLADLGADLAPGDYAFDALDELYDTWSEDGLVSLDLAIQVGIDLETADIADLERILGLDSSDPAERTLSALLAGSESHLAAFTSAMENDGVCTECDGDQSQKALAKREAWANGWQGDQRRAQDDPGMDAPRPGGHRGPDFRSGTPRYDGGEATS